jgi:hypothetical protein
VGNNSPKEFKMIKINLTIVVIIGLLLSACNTSQTSVNNSQPPVSSTELTGTYDCFAIDGTNTSDLGTLTLHADQTATFGSDTIQWMYDAGTNMVLFTGTVAVRDAIYFSEGQSLSINENSDDHFTCIKSE